MHSQDKDSKDARFTDMDHLTTLNRIEIMYKSITNILWHCMLKSNGSLTQDLSQADSLFAFPALKSITVWSLKTY